MSADSLASWPPPPAGSSSSSSSPQAAIARAASSASRASSRRKVPRLIASSSLVCCGCDRGLEQGLLAALAQPTRGRQVLQQSEEALGGEGEDGDRDRARHDAL